MQKKVYMRYRFLLFTGAYILHSKSFKYQNQVIVSLTNALKGPGKSFPWSPVLGSTFHHSKLLLASITILALPEPGAAISLTLDANSPPLSLNTQPLTENS